MLKSFVIFLFLSLPIIFISKNTSEVKINYFLITSLNFFKATGFKKKEINDYTKSLKNKNKILLKKLFYKKINILIKKT